MDLETAWAEVADLALRYADADSEPSGDRLFEVLRDEYEIAILEYARVYSLTIGDRKMASGYAAKIAGAKASQSSNFIKDGAYLFEIEKLLIENKRKGWMFIAELKVLEAVKTSPTVDPNPVGSSVGYVVKLDDPNGMGVGNVKAFIMALYGVEESEVTADDIDEAVNTDPEATNAAGKALAVQPCVGMKIRDEAFAKAKVSKPTEFFTNHKWSHVPQT